MPRCRTMDVVDLIYNDYSTIINDLVQTLDRQAKGGSIPQKAPIGGLERAYKGTVGRESEKREMKGGI